MSYPENLMRCQRLKRQVLWNDRTKRDWFSVLETLMGVSSHLFCQRCESFWSSHPSQLPSYVCKSLRVVLCHSAGEILCLI
jgi:hypothetical protein